MDAAISGAARLAFLVEKDGIRSLHLDAPGQLIARDPSEFRLLLGDAHDVEFLEDVNLVEVERRLAAAADRERALHHASILLDGSWSGETRRRASAELNELLARPEIGTYVESVLYSIPLPEGASPHSAQLYAVGTRVSDLLAALIRAQPAIGAARETWDQASRSVIENAEQLDDARAQAVRSGLFPMMVAAQDGPAQLASLKQRAAEGSFSTVPVAEQLIAEWGAPLEAHWRRLGEVVETYWGYLTTLRSPRPSRVERRNLPALSWPRAEEPGPPNRRTASALDEPPRRETVDGTARRLRDLHEEAIGRANAFLHDTGRMLRRRRLVARLLKAGAGLGALTTVMVAAAAGALMMAAMQFDVTRWALVIAVSSAAAGVFWLLDRVFQPSVGWVRTVREYEALQSVREEFELEWARRLSPVARKTSSEGAVREIEDAAAAFMRRLGGRGTPARHVPAGAGTLRVVIDDIERLAGRRFSVAVADRLSASYSGVADVSLVLPADQYVLRVSAFRSEGDLPVQAELAAIVTDNGTAEVRVRL